MPPAPAKSQPGIWPAVLCALAGAALFQFFGNNTRGYIDTASLFYWWGWQWINPASETQHGFVILVGSLWLFWRNVKREGAPSAESHEPRAEREPPRGENATVIAPALSSQLSAPDWTAPAVILAALALHALGFIAQQSRLSIAALLLFTWGVLALARRSWARAAVFPLGFLVFAVPVNFLDNLGFWLRLWVVDASALLAHAVGIGVVQNGTQLISPDGSYHYDVAAACSGVRSLMALAALALFIGYLRFRPAWLRGAMLLLCAPLALVGNVARMMTIIIAAQIGGQKWGDVAHEVMGVGVFVIVLGGVLLIADYIERHRPDWVSSLVPGSTEPERICHPIGDNLRLAALAGVLLFMGGEIVFLSRVAAQPPRGKVGVLLAGDGRDPAPLPTFLGTDWIGATAEVTAIERAILPPDTGYARKLYLLESDPRARTNPSRQVLLSVVLSGRDRTSIHRPELCLVGQGWTIEREAAHTFHFPGDGGFGFPATILRVQQTMKTPRGSETVPALVAYWFVGGDGVVATHWQRLAHDAWNRVVHGRADRWAYVLVQTGAGDGEVAALARMQAVLDATLPSFQPPPAKKS